MEAGKLEEAIAVYGELAAAYPSVPSLSLNVAIVEYKAGRYRDAVAHCNAALKLQPGLSPAWIFLGASQLELGHPGNALEPLKRAVEMLPADANANALLAQTLLALERYPEAAVRFKEAARLAPDSPRVWYGTGRTYEAAARENLRRLGETAANSAEALALSAAFEADRAQPARAYQLYRRALALDASFSGIHEAIASIYDQTGHADWAATERAKVREEHPDCSTQTIQCEFAAGRYEQIAAVRPATSAQLYWQARAFLELAHKAYARLAELPDSAEKFEAAARAHENAGQYREAAAAWREALKLSPHKAAFERGLAAALYHSNDSAGALPILQDLARRDPASADTNFLCGAALMDLKDAARALPYLENSVKLNGAFLPARAALGEAYLQTGKPQQAIPHLEAAAAKDEDGSRHFLLARALRAAGDQQRAAAVLGEYRQILSRHEAEQAEGPAITPP